MPIWSIVHIWSMLNHLSIPVYVWLCIYTFAYEVSVYNTIFCPGFDISSTTTINSSRLEISTVKMSEAIQFLRSLSFMQHHDIADTYSHLLPNPDWRSRGTAPHFGVSCKCKKQAAYSIVRVIPENSQQYRTKNKNCKELEAFSLYWKQITSVYSWNRFQTFFSFIWRYLRLASFPWWLVRTTQRTVPEVYFISTVLTLSIRPVSILQRGDRLIGKG